MGIEYYIEFLKGPGIPLRDMGITVSCDPCPKDTPLQLHTHLSQPPSARRSLAHVSQVGIGEVGHGSHCGEGGKRINEKDRAIVEEPEANDNWELR
jgi:hypothetical protein